MDQRILTKGFGVKMLLPYCLIQMETQYQSTAHMMSTAHR